ncbi:MAG: thymidine kinase [Bacteroidetes bacterium]|nr:thymidine kinase [Bacteroidota bacterium]MBS1973252.1 thymidine kinase [Bacteroidota bacterium]
MFIEPHIRTGKPGWIEVVCGSMFSGKTEELIRRLKRATIAHLETKIFKPSADIRYHRENIVSHDENAVPSMPVENAQAIIPLSKNVDVVAVDEAQFFDAELPETCEQLALQGIRVIVAGLDMDYTGKPFGPMPDMLARADYITKLHAICVKCGNIANYSYRKSASNAQVLLGEKNLYEPRCRECFYLGEDAKNKIGA